MKTVKELNKEFTKATRAKDLIAALKIWQQIYIVLCSDTYHQGEED